MLPFYTVERSLRSLVPALVELSASITSRIVAKLLVTLVLTVFTLSPDMFHEL